MDLTSDPHSDGAPRADPAPQGSHKKLDEIRPHIPVWWKENAQALQLLVDGELELCSVPQGRIADLVVKGRPLGVEVNGAGYDLDSWHNKPFHYLGQDQ